MKLPLLKNNLDSGFSWPSCRRFLVAALQKVSRGRPAEGFSWPPCRRFLVAALQKVSRGRTAERFLVAVLQKV